MSSTAQQPSVSGLVKSVHVSPKAPGDRAITSGSGDTVSHTVAPIPNRHSYQRGLGSLLKPLSPWHLPSWPLPTFPHTTSGLGIYSREVEFKFRSQHTGQEVRGLPPSKVCKGGVPERPLKSSGENSMEAGSHSIPRVGVKPTAPPTYSWL